MRGYRPTNAAECESVSLHDGMGIPLHESFAYRASARYELEIEVRLSPSCLRCFVVVRVGRVREPVGGEVLDLSSREVVEIEDGGNSLGNKRDRGDDVQVSAGSVRKSRRVMNQAGSVPRRGNNRRHTMNHVSSDESDGVPRPSAPIAVRRSGRASIPSKRALFSIEESDDGSSTTSADASRSKSNRPMSRQISTSSTSNTNGKSTSRQSSYQTPAFTRSTSSQSNDSMCTYTGDICLDGGKMKVETIVKHLSRGLPRVDGVLLFDGESYSKIGDDDNSKSLDSAIETIDEIDDDYLMEYVGDFICGYTARKRPMSLRGSGGIESPNCEEEIASFVVSLADMRKSSEARKYHDEVEKLAPWWVETADCVHMGSTRGISAKGGAKGGHWKVLYLFEQHKKTQTISPRRISRIEQDRRTPRYSLAGYMTILFHETKMYICQVLILPPYQRSGHGSQLLQSAYKTITNRITQIDVELPGKAFVCLRDKVDYVLLRNIMATISQQGNGWNMTTKHEQPIRFSRDKASLTLLPDDIIEDISSRSKIAKRQVQIGYEIWLLSKIDECIESKLKNLDNVTELNKKITSLETCYKSVVKSSLLEEMSNKDEQFCSLCFEDQQEKLEARFTSTIIHYRAILQH